MRSLFSLLKTTRKSKSQTCLLLPYTLKTYSSTTTTSTHFHLKPFLPLLLNKPIYTNKFPSFLHNSSAFSHPFSSSASSSNQFVADENLVIEEWEEDDDEDPETGDGGAGGGIVLQNVSWGEQALAIAREVLQQFGDDMQLYSFKTTPSGYIYVRLDKLSNEYGSPTLTELESYSRQYKTRLDEVGSKGEIPDDLALEVSSPGADRLLRVPEDLDRFKEFPMVLSYVELETETDAKPQEKSGVFFIDSMDTESEHCVWKLADVKENKERANWGRPLNRKRRDWRLKLPFSMLKKVTLHIS